MADSIDNSNISLCSLIDGGLKVDRVLQSSSEYLYDEFDREERRILEVLSRHGKCNESELEKMTVRYLMDRQIIRRRILGTERELGLKGLNFVLHQRLNKKKQQFSLSLKGLMAALQFDGITFEEIFPVRYFCKIISDWAAGNATLVQACLQCMKYDLALFMYSHKVSGFKLTSQRDTVPFFLSWNKSHPLVRGYYWDPWRLISQEEKVIIQALQYRLLLSQTICASLVRQFEKKEEKLRSALPFYLCLSRQERRTGYEYMKYILDYLHNWPEFVESVQFKTGEDVFEPDRPRYGDSSASGSHYIYGYSSAVRDRASYILKVEKFQPDVSQLNLVWQGEFYDPEEEEENKLEMIELIESEEWDKVQYENRDKNLSEDELRRIYHERLEKRYRRAGLIEDQSER